MSLVECLGDLAGEYDAVFCDAWGVIHNGLRGNPPALAALRHVRGSGVPVIILTNAPRTQAQLEAHFASMGVESNIYDAIISSGEVGRDSLVNMGVSQCYHIGPKIDEELLRGSQVGIVADPQNAQVIFNTGLRDNTREQAESYLELMRELVRLNLPMICVNPDKHVHIGTERRDCAGALAQIYEELGGNVTWLGKPFKEIYLRAEEKLSEISGLRLDPKRILAIGDAVHTDILGASRMGYRTLFVQSGIHKEELVGAGINDRSAIDLLAFCEPRGARPDYFINFLR